MARRPSISNVGEDAPVARMRRTPPARIARSPGLFVSPSPPQTSFTNNQAPSSGLRRAIAVELTPAPPGTLDKYVDIEGSDIVLKVLREVNGEGGPQFQVKSGDTHTEMVSSHDFVVNASQGSKLFGIIQTTRGFRFTSRLEANQTIMC